MVFLSSSSAHAPQPGQVRLLGVEGGAQRVRRGPGQGGGARRDRRARRHHRPVATPMLDDVHFPMRTLAPSDVVEVIAWLDTLAGNIVLPEIDVSSVDSGPFAPEAFVPEAARERGRTELAT